MKIVISFSVAIVGLVALSGCGSGPHGPTTSLGGGGNSASGKKLDYANVVKPILVNRCGTCHMPGGALPNWQDYQTAFGKKDVILKRVVVEKTMPPAAASTITEAERTVIGQWIQAGAPQDSNSDTPGTPGTTPPGPPTPPTAPPDFAPIKDLVMYCGACHDHDGNSEQPRFPRIAGQQENYLETTLKAFREKLRKEPDASTFMWGMMANRDDKTLTLLAQYFSAKTATPNKKGDATLAAAGKVLFENGNPDKGLIACSSCHGLNGEGSGIAPRLAGQHIEYLTKQLAAFRDGQRTEATMMPPIAKAITDSDEKALVNYIQGL